MCLLYYPVVINVTTCFKFFLCLFILGDVVSSKRFAAKFSDFCANKGDELLKFWNEACQYVREKDNLQNENHSTQ